MTKNKQSQRLRREQRARAAMGARPKQGPSAVWWAVAATVAVVAVIAVMVVLRSVTGGGSSNAKGTSTGVPAAVMREVSSIPAATFNAVGTGGSRQLSYPVKLGGRFLKIDGKPGVVYVGAEYCPYCAAERWPFVVALSRFGSFRRLGATHSASTDVYPDTATFSFHGATYSSPYIAFQGVETESNTLQGNGYAPLDPPTPLERDLFIRYDRPPYFPKLGGIPFIDIGNRYGLSGTAYLPSVLSGLTLGQIAAELRDPSSPVAQSILGASNSLSAAVCSVTGQKPANVCTSSGVAAAAKKLGGG
jgi:Domain of unknown function (DUF929)